MHLSPRCRAVDDVRTAWSLVWMLPDCFISSQGLAICESNPAQAEEAASTITWRLALLLLLGRRADSIQPVLALAIAELRS